MSEHPTFHMHDYDDGQAMANERCYPRRVPLTTALRPALRKLAARRSEFGDEMPLRLPLGAWIHVYRWSHVRFGWLYDGWYEDWYVLVGRKNWSRSFMIGHAREQR